MSQKKVVSIEDRIPKLKQARKKKTNRRLIFYVSIFFILISVIVYLQSPLSHVQHVVVSGNNFISDEDIQNLSGLSEENSFWSVDKEQIIASISVHPEVKSVNVSKKFPTTVRIDVDELQRVGYVKEQDQYYSLLENGALLSSIPLDSINGDAPLLAGFDNDTYLQELTKELVSLPTSIGNLISEIYWEPTEGNPFHIVLYMNDGYKVEGSIRNFSKSMKSYPSIVSQLEPGSRGVIHLGVGAYFESFETITDEDLDEVENKIEQEEVYEDEAIEEEIIIEEETNDEIEG